MLENWNGEKWKLLTAETVSLYTALNEHSQTDCVRFLLKKTKTKQEKTSSAKQPTIRLLGISIAFLLQSPWDVGCRKKKTPTYLLYMFTRFPELVQRLRYMNLNWGSCIYFIKFVRFGYLRQMKRDTYSTNELWCCFISLRWWKHSRKHHVVFTMSVTCYSSL